MVREPASSTLASAAFISTMTQTNSYSSAEIRYPSLEAAECPYPLLGELRTEAPIYQVPGTNEYLVTRYEDVVEILRDPERFSNALARGDRGQSHDSEVYASTIASDPPAHKTKRNLIARHFSPGRLREYEPVIESITNGLIDDFVAAGRVEFIGQFATPLPILIFCELFFGDAREDFDKFRVWATLEGSGIRYFPEDRKAEAEARRSGHSEYLESEILKRWKNPQGDVLSEIVSEQVDRDGELNLRYLVSEAGLLLAGGFVTTAHMIGSAMRLLAESPETMVDVRRDPKRIPAILDEALRIESPVQWQHRVARVDTEVSGVRIPAGSTVVVVLASGNRDERQFPDPTRFVPDRQNLKRHVAFGYGAHFCLGAPLGRLEGRIAFERLLSRLGEIRIAAENDFKHLESPLFRGLKELHLEFQAS